jgi:hypothetical protein
MQATMGLSREPAGERSAMSCFPCPQLCSIHIKKSTATLFPSPSSLRKKGEPGGEQVSGGDGAASPPWASGSSVGGEVSDPSLGYV